MSEVNNSVPARLPRRADRASSRTRWAVRWAEKCPHQHQAATRRTSLSLYLDGTYRIGYVPEWEYTSSKKEAKPMSDCSPFPDDEILPEYSLKGGVRGKYAGRYAEGTNVLLLDRDMAEMFPDSESVNQALREFAETRRSTTI
ncbi:MAG TPA: hypothetical protein VF710_06075 [Longimicrobium sp.]